MNKQTLVILGILCAFATSLIGAPDWWDNPDNFASWTHYETTGSVQNSGGSQAQDVNVKIDIPNLGIERNTKDIWVQIEWEASGGDTTFLNTEPASHTVKWTYDECPVSPSAPFTNIVDADFLVHEGTFTPTNEISIGNTYDHGDEFSLQIDEQPECERLFISFSVEPNQSIEYRIEIQTVCWGVIDVAGDCPTPSPGLYPGATDVVLLEFTMDTDVGGDALLDQLTLVVPMTSTNTNEISIIEIKKSTGTTLAGPTTWNPTTGFLLGGSFYFGQTFTFSSEELINENQITCQVLVDVKETASVGTDVNIQIYDSTLVSVSSAAVVLNDEFPIICSSSIRTLSTNLENFTAESCVDGINLVWQALKKNNTAGFNVYRQDAVGDSYSKINNDLISVSPSLLPVKEYSYTDDNVIEAETYSYMIEEISTSGQAVKSRPLSVTFYSSTAVENRFKPDEFALAQNYPNPFNPSTSISYHLATQSHVELHIYDVTGRLIAELINANQSVGAHQIKWNGVNNHGETVANGVYLLTMRAGEHFFTRKMTLMR